MAEGVVETSANNQKPPPPDGVKNPSRRKLFKNSAKLIVGATISTTGFGKVAELISKVPTPELLPPLKTQELPKEAFEQPDSEKPDLDAFKNSLKSGNKSPSSSTPIVSDSPEEKDEEIAVDGIIEEFFPNYTDDEKEFMRKKIDNSIEYFKTQRYPGYGQLEMAVVNSIRWEDLVDSTLKNMDLNKNFLHSKVPDLFTGLIFVESEGNPQAYNEASGATGLTQVVPTTAGKEISEDLGEPNFDLTDPATSIRFGIYYLAKMYKEYPEVGLNIWVYHLGMGNLLKTVRAKLGDQTIDFDNVAQKVVDNHLNLANLLNSPFTEEQIKEGNFSDMTEEYVSRILAGYYFQKKYLVGQLED